MTDFRGLRETIRTEAPSEPQTGVGGLIAWSLACVVAGWVAYLAVGFLRTPSSQPLQPSISLPTFSGDANKATPAPSISPSQGAAIRVTPAEIAGKSADEIGKLADGVCFKRAQALHPHWSKTPRLTNKLLDEFHLDDMDHFNALMQCLLTEAPQRYCTASQRRMIASEVNHYFLAIAYMNRDLEQLQRLAPNADLTFNGEPLPTAVADRAVVASIEARLRDGYLTKDEIAKLGQNAPQDLRARFTQIMPPKARCPEQPWWAFWRV